jgi:hypothetical protein
MLLLLFHGAWKGGIAMQLMENIKHSMQKSLSTAPWKGFFVLSASNKL